MPQQTNEKTQARADDSSRPRSNAASLSFWGTLVLMAVATVGVALIVSLRASNTNQAVELAPTVVEQVLSNVASRAMRVAALEIDRNLADVYKPVYDAIPEYVDFHYSVWGEYVELGSALAGRMGTDLQERLFRGFEERLTSAGTDLDRQYRESYVTALDEEVRATIDEDNPDTVLGEATQHVLDDAVARASVSYPIAGAASIAGSGGLKALTAGLTTKVLTKIATKAGTKGTLKGGGALIGAGGAAAMCALGGPLAIACGVAGGIVAWLLVDAVFVNLDEFFNQDEFEAHLRELVDQHKSEMKNSLEEALRDKARLLDEAAAEIVEDFRLRELGSAESDN